LNEKALTTLIHDNYNMDIKTLDLLDSHFGTEIYVVKRIKVKSSSKHCLSIAAILKLWGA
jgi:hypothetical protein